MENDAVNNPSHYTDGKIEVIEFIEDKELNFHRGNAVKYIARAGKKDPTKEIEDLRKAIWYLERECKKLEELILKNDSLSETIQWYDNDIQKVREQAVKDTAKKILQGMLSDMHKLTGCGVPYHFKAFVKEWANRYGVEVE